MGCVIFDLDGTLADTSRDLIAAANVRLADHGVAPLDPFVDARTAFAGGRAMLRLGFLRAGWSSERIENTVAADYAAFIEVYKENIARETTLYPGVRQAIARLAKAGYRLGVCTNKPVGLADDLLRRLNLRDPFDGFVGAGSLPVNKPDPKPLQLAVADSDGAIEQSILVGDTITDRDTARAAGTKVVLVTFGPSGRDVEALEPDALLDHFDRLPDLASRMFGRPWGSA